MSLVGLRLASHVGDVVARGVKDAWAAGIPLGKELVGSWVGGKRRAVVPHIAAAMGPTRTPDGAIKGKRGRLG